MKRKVFAALIAAALSVILCLGTVLAANQAVAVNINGQPLVSDVPAQIVNDRTLVPLRAIFEALGATVDWDGDTQTVTATNDTTVIVLVIGDNKMSVNDNIVELDVPAQIIDNRTMVPARAVSEALGANVAWDGVNSIVDITTSAPEPTETPEPSDTPQATAPPNDISTPTDSPAPDDGNPLVTDGAVTVTSPVHRNENATLMFTGKPNTEYSISVYYSSSKSTAQGLENKTSDASGQVVWTWKIGGSTNPGTYRIVIKGGGETFETHITVEV